jgi:hypothetical protein
VTPIDKIPDEMILRWHARGHRFLVSAIQIERFGDMTRPHALLESGDPEIRVLLADP